MVIAIDQPNYIPWKGYFDLIHDVDLFIFYTDVQYTSRDWRNRNKIITPNGEKWLTVPVGQNVHRKIYEVKMTDKAWQRNHFETMRYAYGKAPFFREYSDFLEEVYLGMTWEYLTDLDQYLIKHIAKEFLGIKTEFADSRSYKTSGTKSERLLGLIESVGRVQAYESGPKAKNYLDERSFRDRGIEVRWKSYDAYPEYPQMSETFNHQMSVFDLLFNVGKNAPYYIWGWREEKGVCSYFL